ncbi:PREDICTED: uncharacterized protein LOC106808959 [Priapulus caudatus]|uniref:Uncharacterized protein LOC106808959 n=1 Tax=Priapulus caudatus TaxID=37621 RepID=A0ABM1E5A5_PRICU|nr:PREDICTED: uncharacterized protein LOC106808959 [Priapulus caudatus]
MADPEWIKLHPPINKTLSHDARVGVAVATATLASFALVGNALVVVAAARYRYRTEYPLPEGWRQTLPEADHRWVSRALFHFSSRGMPELDSVKLTQQWFYPPQPLLNCDQAPRPDHYFASRLLLWMPQRMWKVRLLCPHPRCRGQELTGAGIYPRLRQVLDIDGFYHLAAEYLECKNCNGKLISWSRAIVEQLDVGHQVQFRVLLTYRNACDVRVIALMRQRTLGNSATALQQRLEEAHSDAWLRNACHYLADCKAFKDAQDRHLLCSMPAFQDPPTARPVPKAAWLLRVYCSDVMRRIDEVKASITSTYGRVLKMDSTKKVVRKLAGHVNGTAAWATNIGNEYGQVLNSVLTSGNGFGLAPMVSGIVKRYSSAGIAPPEVLYVGRGCCGDPRIRDIFAAWPDLIIRLDVWHFMRRLAAGCTTESHQLYGVFMSRLSACIFEWSGEDLQALKNAKRSELLAQHVEDPSEDDVVRRLSKKELALHCRRKTRGTAESTRLIGELLDAFTGEQGCDTSGTPLLDAKRMTVLWESQEQHVACIQDPAECQLYTQTGTRVKGTVSLPVYTCARGLSSLESFHLHLARFIPGTSASDVHYQMYLLEGLARWNKDRAKATKSEPDCRSYNSRSYNSRLMHACNELSSAVLGKTLISGFDVPAAYTGELIGVEYLYSQTGAVLQDLALDPDSREAAQYEATDDIIDAEADESFADAGLADDLTLPPVERSVRLPSNPVTRPDTQPLITDSSAATPEGLDSVAEDSVGPDNIGGFARDADDNAPETTLWYRADGSWSKLALPPASISVPLATDVSPQCISVPLPAAASADRLPAAWALSAVAQAADQPQHTYEPPDNTAGQMHAACRKLALPPASISVPLATDIPSCSSQAVYTSNAYVPRTTLWYQKRKLARAQAGQITRAYRKRAPTVCKKCQKERGPAQHRQYYGNWYCAATSTVPFQQWWAEMEEKRRANRRQ